MEIDLEAIGDAPIELDCPDCGKRHIIDPAEVRRFLSRRRFRCAYCGVRKRMVELAGLTNDDSGLGGFCHRCEKGLDL